MKQKCLEVLPSNSGTPPPKTYYPPLIKKKKAILEENLMLTKGKKSRKRTGRSTCLCQVNGQGLDQSWLFHNVLLIKNLYQIIKNNKNYNEINLHKGKRFTNNNFYIRKLILFFEIILEFWKGMMCNYFTSSTWTTYKLMFNQMWIIKTNNPTMSFEIWKMKFCIIGNC